MANKFQLKTLRELKNYSQSYVAEKMGITQSYYSKLENGHGVLTHEMIDKAINALGVQMPHPLLTSKIGLLETFEEYQAEFEELKKKVLLLEQQVRKINIELENRKKIVKK